MENEDLKQSKRFFIIDWLISLKLSLENQERLFLYVFIGVLIAIVYILSMLVIKQYIQQKNMYKKLQKPDIHEYSEKSAFKQVPTKKSKNQENKDKKPLNTVNNDSNKPLINSNKNNANGKIQNNSTLNLNKQGNSPKFNKKNNSSMKSESNHSNTDSNNSRSISKSSANLYTETASSDVPLLLPPNGKNSKNFNNNNTNPINQYERLNNNFNNNPNFIHQSHSNLYNYTNGLCNNVDNNSNFDNFDGFKLITRNGSTKIVNGQNDDISEYEIPIIRYNDRSMMQQYNHLDN